MCQVKRRSFLGLSATILGSGLIAGKTGHAFLNSGQEAPGSIHHHVRAVHSHPQQDSPSNGGLFPGRGLFIPGSSSLAKVKSHHFSHH